MHYRFAFLLLALLPAAANASLAIDATLSCSGALNIVALDPGHSTIDCSGNLSLTGGTLRSDGNLIIRAAGSLNLDGTLVVGPAPGSAISLASAAGAYAPSHIASDAAAGTVSVGRWSGNVDFVSGAGITFSPVVAGNSSLSINPSLEPLQISEIPMPVPLPKTSLLMAPGLVALGSLVRGLRFLGGNT